MSNEVAEAKQTGLGALNALKTGLQQVRAKMPETGGSAFLRLLTDGDWVFGQEDNEVKDGTEAVVNPLSIKHGYVSWPDRKQSPNGSKRPREYMVGLSQPLPAAHEMPAQEESDPNTVYQPWADQIAFDLKFVDGKHKGTQVTYKTNSVGGMNASRALLDAILAKLAEDSAYVCPVVALGKDSYKHPTYGKTYVPVFEIVGWANLEGEEEDGTAPAAVEDKSAASEPEPEKAEEPAEEPVRRRRRA